jgi:hypothetical protein
MSGPPTVGPYHITFASPFAAAVSAPVIEYLTLYFPTLVDRVSFGETWRSFVQTAGANAEGYYGSAAGWIVEELEHEKVEGKARGFAVAIGWESVDAHMKYRETEAFKGSIGSLRSAATVLSVVSPRLGVMAGVVANFWRSIMSSLPKDDFQCVTLDCRILYYTRVDHLISC